MFYHIITMDSEILLDYVRTKRQLVQEKNEEEDKEVEKVEAEVHCHHEEQFEHAGYTVCSKCGLVMANIYMPEVNWRQRFTYAKTYTDSDRIQGVNRHLLHFLDKVKLTLPHAQHQLFTLFKSHYKH